MTVDVQEGATGWLIKKSKEDASGQVTYYSKEGSLEAFDDLSVAPQLILE